jgi:hypothetical protein
MNLRLLRPEQRISGKGYDDSKAHCDSAALTVTAVPPVAPLAESASAACARGAIHRPALGYQLDDDGGKIKFAVAIGAWTDEPKKRTRRGIERVQLRRRRGCGFGEVKISVYGGNGREGIAYGRCPRSIGKAVVPSLRSGAVRAARGQFHDIGLAARVTRNRCSACTSSRVSPVLAATIRNTR